MKQMLLFITQVQAAAIFSFCLARDRLIPEPNYELLYEADDIHSPGNIEYKLELAENFTQFLRRNNNKDLDEYNSAKLKDHAANVWSRLEKNINNGKLATSTTDLPMSTTVKYEFMDYETNSFRIATKKAHVKTPDMEGFQVMKLLEEPEPDGIPVVMRRFVPVENPFDLVTNNHEEPEIGIDPHDDLFNLQKIFKKDQPEELAILKHIATAGNFSTATTKNFILNELPKEIPERSKEDYTLKNVVKLNYTLNNMAPNGNELHIEDNAQNNVNDTNNKHPTKRRDLNTLIETNDDHTLKLEKIPNRENQIINILKRQTHLLEQVAKILDTKQQEKEAIRTMASFKDFENILQEVNKKREMLDKDTNMTQVAVDTVKQKLKRLSTLITTKYGLTTTATKQQRMLPTVMTVIDETEVRNALKNDPYVQRILKMAKRKRTQYLKDAAKYLSS